MISLGVDVGSTTTHHALWRLEPLPADREGAWGPPRCLRESPVWPTPWRDDGTLDPDELARLHAPVLAQAGFAPGTPLAGGILVTGMASRAPNVREALDRLGPLLPGLLPVIASPREESRLAGRAAGARAAARSRLRPCACLDVGGGTANLAVFTPDGREYAASLRLGGRMVRVREGRVSAFTRQAAACAARAGVGLETGTPADPVALAAVARAAAEFCREALEGSVDPTVEDVPWDTLPPEAACVFLAGGVGECAREDGEPFRYGDLGPLLGTALRGVFAERVVFPKLESRRATVTGLSVERLQLSGRTVCDRRPSGEAWTDRPFVRVDLASQDRSKWGTLLARDPGSALGLRLPPLSWDGLRELACDLATARAGEPLLVVLEADLGQALGSALRSVGWSAPLVALDGLALPEADRLDVWARGADGTVAVAFRSLEFPEPVW